MSMRTQERHLTEDQLLSAAEGESLPEYLKQHLVTCTRCGAEVESLRAAVRVVSDAPQPQLSVHLRRHLIHRFRRRQSKRSLLPRIVTFRIPIYQAAGLAAAAVLLWTLLAPTSRRDATVHGLTRPPTFHTAQPEVVPGP